ncbi:unnamed protein product [Echinostoma caproni]|uniref:Uncharacterized protein n=1 Tax=Echinostoma caproni TaxID=27848 RepID=A0A3P8GH75_9TREM|nr:unnamed protein product [Echinostoma caproni]
MTELLQRHAQLVSHNPNVPDPQLDSIKSDYYCLLTRTEARIRKAQLRRSSVDFESFPARGPVHREISPEIRVNVSALGHVNGSLNESEMLYDVRFGPRNSGGNRGIAKCFWPYDHSWDTADTVPNKSRAPRQTGPLNRIDALVQQSAKTVQHTKVLNQLARSVRKINEELTGAELDDYKSFRMRSGPMDELPHQNQRGSSMTRLAQSYNTSLDMIQCEQKTGEMAKEGTTVLQLKGFLFSEGPDTTRACTIQPDYCITELLLYYFY